MMKNNDDDDGNNNTGNVNDDDDKNNSSDNYDNKINSNCTNVIIKMIRTKQARTTTTKTIVILGLNLYLSMQRQ